MRTTTLKIQNLKCGGCANTIVTQLSKLEGITKVIVDNTTDEVQLYSDTGLLLKKVIKKLSELGYPIFSESNSLSKKAKSFVSCVVGSVMK